MQASVPVHSSADDSYPVALPLDSLETLHLTDWESNILWGDESPQPAPFCEEVDEEEGEF